MMSEDNNLQEVGKQVAKRGRGGNANFPNSRAGLVTTAEDRALVSKLLGEVMVEYKQPKVKTDEELAQRISDYFERCTMTGQIPTVEEMCMSTGFSQEACYGWEVGKRGGFSSETGKIIKKAKAFLKSFDAKLAVSGKLNFLTYCFRAKNYYSMTDKQEVVITPNNPLGEEQTASQVADQVRMLKEGVIAED